MSALVKEQFIQKKRGFTAEYKQQMIEKYKKDNAQMLLDKPWLKPVFIRGSVIAKYCPTVEHFIDFFLKIETTYRYKTELKRFVDQGIIKYGFVADRKRIYKELEIKETKEQREKRKSEESLEVQWVKEVGSGLTPMSYLDVFFKDTTGLIPVAYATPEGKWIQRHFSNTKQVVNFIAEHTELDCYVSPNTVFMNSRLSENVRELTAVYLDLDIYNNGLSVQEALKIIDEAVDSGLFPLPTLTNYSGQGLQLQWKLERHAPGKNKAVQSLWSRVMKGLFNVANELGLAPDENAMDMVRVLRFVGTKNSKTGNEAEVLEYNPEALYSLTEFAEQGFAPFPKKQKKTSGGKSSKGRKKVKYLLTEHSLYVNRIADIETIIKDRGKKGIDHKNREITLFIYRYFNTVVHGDDVALEKTLELNAQLHNPLSEKEVFHKTKITNKRRKQMEGKETVIHKGEEKEFGYHYSNEKLISLLKLEDDEIRELQLKTIISKAEKNERDKVRKKADRRDENGLTSRQNKANKVFEQVKALLEQGMKQKDIAERVGVSKVRVSQINKAIKKLNETSAYIECVNDLSSSSGASPSILLADCSICSDSHSVFSGINAFQDASANLKRSSLWGPTVGVILHDGTFLRKPG